MYFRKFKENPLDFYYLMLVFDVPQMVAKAQTRVFSQRNTFIKILDKASTKTTSFPLFLYLIFMINMNCTIKIFSE